MENIKYNELGKLETKKLVFELANLLRGKMQYFDYQVNLVASAFIIYLYSKWGTEYNVNDFINNEIDDETTKSFLNDFGNNLNFETMRKISIDANENEVLSIIFSNEIDNNDMSTPFGIIDLSSRLLELTEYDTVLDLGSGKGNLLNYVGSYFNVKNRIGIEINTKNILISNIRKIVLGLDIHYIQSDLLNYDYTNINASKVFSNAPFGLRWPEISLRLNENKVLMNYLRGVKSTISGDWVFAIIAMLNHNINGKSVVVMSNAGTWNKADRLIRERLVEEGRIEGVISLPSNLFNGTQIPVSILVLSQNNKKIKLVDASQIFTQGRRVNTLEENDVEKIMNIYNSESDLSASVDIELIREQEYILNPNRYIQSVDNINTGLPLSYFCTTISRGAMKSSSELDDLVSKNETNFKYLMLKNIQNGLIDKYLPSLKYIEEKDFNYCIKNNNLIISKNSPFKVARAVIDEGTKVLANGNLYFIELDDSRINPVFLEFFMQSELGIAQLERYAKGTAIKNISIQDLKEIKIPNLTREKQDEIADLYLGYLEELEILEKQSLIIKEKKDKLIEGIF